jgi:ribonuclease BN (tRNA processing enzyme)
VTSRSSRTARFTVVGCGTVVPEADRSCSAYMLETADRRLLLDCGPGTVRSLARVDAEWAAITDIWVSHFHTDHVGDLPGLLFSLKWGLLPERRSAPLTVWGPTGIRRVLRAFAEAAGDPVFDLGFELRVQEVSPGTRHALGDGLELRTLKTPHTQESLALRLEGESWSMAYSGDTGPAVALGEFATGVDLFVCECSLPEDLAGEIHVSPSAVAHFASVAEPGMLLVTHVYPQFRAAADVLALIRAAGWPGPASLAREGWTTSLG